LRTAKFSTSHREIAAGTPYDTPYDTLGGAPPPI